MLVQIPLTKPDETVRVPQLNGRYRVKLVGIDWSDTQDKNKKYLLKIVSPNISNRTGNVLFFSNKTDHHHVYGDATFEIDCPQSFTVSSISGYAGDVFDPSHMEYCCLSLDILEQLN